MSWLLLGGMLPVAANGFFVAAEFALVRVRRSRLEEAKADDARAVVALQEVDRITEYLQDNGIPRAFSSLTGHSVPLLHAQPPHPPPRTSGPPT